jgi:hypothetical protein
VVASFQVLVDPQGLRVSASHELRDGNAEGVQILQPRVARDELPWGNRAEKPSTLQGLHLNGDRSIQPLWDWRPSGRTQGKRSSVAPTLGWLMQRPRRWRAHECMTRSSGVSLDAAVRAATSGHARRRRLHRHAKTKPCRSVPSRHLPVLRTSDAHRRRVSRRRADPLERRNHRPHRPPASIGDGVIYKTPGHAIEYPMALVIIGGLVTSTLLNLFVVPALYGGFGQSRRPSR